MKTPVAVSFAVLVLASMGVEAQADGTWVKERSECSIPSGQRDEFSISGNEITNLEFGCNITSKSRKNGYTVAKAVCGGEGYEDRETIRYRADSQGALHIKIGKQAEKIYRYSCSN